VVTNEEREGAAGWRRAWCCGEAVFEREQSGGISPQEGELYHDGILFCEEIKDKVRSATAEQYAWREKRE
jgi:hypothetical protein